AGCLNTGSLGNSAGASDSGKDFGVWGPASISGNVFEDADADGVAKETGESGLSGRTVYIDSNSNSAFDAGEPSATTAANGDYTLASVSPGTYTIRRVLPAGWTCSFPSPCSYSVTVAGANVTGKDFGAGTNGTSAAAGSYSFTRAPGSYRVRVVVPSGWTCSQPSPCNHQLTLTSQSSSTGRDFGMYTTGTIRGTVYEDANFNKSVPDAGETGLTGETVYLDANDNGARDAGETQA